MLSLMSVLNNLAILATDNVTTVTLGENILKWCAGLGGALIAVALIFSIVKDAIGYAKGTGSNSVGKMVGKVIVVFVMLGIVALAINWTSIANGFGKRVTEAGQNVVENVVNSFTESSP